MLKPRLSRLNKSDFVPPPKYYIAVAGSRRAGIVPGFPGNIISGKFGKITIRENIIKKILIDNIM